MPDFEHIRKELLRNGVNKKLLWTEYLEECRLNGEEPLMYSRFCYYIQRDEEKRRASMHISRKPGEQVEVDWAGDPAYLIDPDTGELTKVSVFVGVMSYSQYAYAEAFPDEKQTSWITAHVNMYTTEYIQTLWHTAGLLRCLLSWSPVFRLSNCWESKTELSARWDSQIRILS